MPHSGMKVRMKAPGPNDYTGFHNLLLLKKKNHLNFFKDFHEEYGDVVRFRFGPILVHLIAHPDHIKQVLVVKRDKYIKGKAYKKLKAFIGSGLITSEGEMWKRHRKLAQPFFSPSAIAQFDKSMVEIAQETALRWEELAAKGQPISMVDEMIALTAKAITRTMFGTDIGESSHICKCFADALEYVSRKTSSLVNLPLYAPTRDNLHFKRCLREIHTFIEEIISKRENTDGIDLLSKMLSEDGAFTNEEIRDQLVTLFFAGHETTSLLLSWTWYCLSQHPEVEAKVMEELNRVLNGRPPTHTDIPQLIYTRKVIDEVLRIYPPVWGFARESAEEDTIGGFHIPKGSLIMLCPWVTHRHRDFWENPETFDPERIRPEHKFAYFPFSMGPRQCIGNHMALQEGILVLATLMQKFHLKLASKATVEPNPVGTVHPKSPILMHIHSLVTA